MAITNRERVEKALEYLKSGLGPFIEREFENAFSENASNEARGYLRDDPITGDKPIADWDSSALLRLMWFSWNDVFRNVLGHAERSLVSELREHRNRWAHQESFSSDDTDRALDSAERLLTAISAPESEDVRKVKMELRRLTFDEQVRAEKRKGAASVLESTVTGQLKPWREVVTPHKDVASGRYQQAEFAADLWQVYLGEGSDEYKNPVEFFRRTYLTASLKQMLVGAVQRLGGGGGDPVVQLQTNFGGGKTHSMLALLHLFSGVEPSQLAGIDAVMSEAGVAKLPYAKAVVLVGNKISPGNPSVKPDGTKVSTLWGELAWQLGGKVAFERIRADDENATNPGDALRELMVEYGPCLILIDEWVAYARQLHDDSNLPAGSFETQFTFAQALTESAKLANNCLLVISLPASDTSGSPHTRADDVEVGGARGREALDRLRNVVGRVESSWRPATAEEGFEIVRRRLFEPLAGPDEYKARDVVAQAFADMYRAQQQEFPPECREGDYLKRLKAAYPIHPEIFDRLYTDWSTLVKFQRTRGVLRLMAAVIHTLWEKGDRNPLIMPSMVPIDDQRVQSELTRYLSDNWAPVIEKDVDGPNSLPLEIDTNPTFGKLHATRRVARTVYLGSAPLAKAAHQGLEDRRVKLGCVMPGESPAVFGDALRRLASSATYLYQDGSRYWYSTQPTVTKIAEDRAEQLKREPDKVIQELERRLRADLRQMGDFRQIHTLPQSGVDVPDDLDARLVVLSCQHPYSKEVGNAAEVAAKAIFETRGNTPRLYRNALVFLAADKTRLQDLDEAARRYLAWKSLCDERQNLNLDPQQVEQARTQEAAADGAVTARLPETYQWLLAPVQNTPQDAIEWQATRLSGSESLAKRASKKLHSDELLVSVFAATRLRMELDRVPLWRENDVEVKQLVEDFARYVYLPRLSNSSVLLSAIYEGVASLMWEQETFAYADSWDETTERYRGLRGGQSLPALSANVSGLLVKPTVSRKQMDVESTPTPAHNDEPPSDEPEIGTGGDTTIGPTSAENGVPASKPQLPKRFHGSVELDATRVGRDAGKIADEVIAHLAGLVGAEVTVTLEIEAHLPSGASEQIVRTVTENGRTLKFSNQGFEEE